MDERHILSGVVVPGGAYCDQVYVVQTNDGAWMAAMTTGKGKEGQRGQHIVATRSLDEGKSWSPLIDVEPASGPEASFAVLLKADSGRIYAFYNYNTDRIEEVRGEEGYSFARADCVGDYVFKYSDDNGLTWSGQRHKVVIREFAVDRENIYGGSLRFFWNVGRPFVGKDGKAYLPHTKVAAMGEGFYAQSEGALLCSPNIMRETDPEKVCFTTLPEGEIGLRTPAGGGRIAEEQSCVELSDGSLYCVYRSIDGFPVCTYSRDKGKTWEPPGYKCYRPGGRALKHPRAANFVWRCKNGRYLYWFHNHGGGIPARGNWNPYHGRNPVWLTAGREVATQRGLVLEWAQPEIILYDDDPCIRMSYPDLIESDESFFVTETQKSVARVHRLDPRALDLLFRQHELAEVRREGLLLELIAPPALPEEIDMPALPDFYVRDSSREDQAGKRTRLGFSIEMRLLIPAGMQVDSILLDTVSENGRGMRIRLESDGRLSVELSDGQTTSSWKSQRHAFVPGKNQTATLIGDGGPGIISCVMDGELLDGGSELQFGWGRFSPFLTSANGKPRAALSANLMTGLRLYGHPLLASEAVGNWRSGW